ncbi:hypothetical protein BCON_0247g00090 [Botryotinia convoluta]|uniref:Uncharacterized protein n=1 Tax=Botryotinia convoluta TaxID=54673 RepID=A0A4Z1HHD0_9HELO|nr:hypothetical protein BCON_0247g00090 [Botryotinia convoluta]
MNAFSKEKDRTTPLMKCVLHITGSQALNGPEPQARKNIIGNFIFIHHGVCERDLLQIIEQMVKVKILLPSGNREVCWKTMYGDTERENSPLFTIHPECDNNKYRSGETCAKHPYKYLLPPQSSLGPEYSTKNIERSERFFEDLIVVADLTKQYMASVKNGDDLEADKLIHQAIGLTRDQNRKFDKKYRRTQATMGDASISGTVQNESLESCDRTNLPSISHVGNVAPSNSQPLASLRTSRKNDEGTSDHRLARLYKVPQRENCIKHIRCHIDGAAYADRVESRVTRNGETTITTRYVQTRKERLEKIRGKDPISSRWTWWLDENQAPKSRDGNVANVKTQNGILAKKSAVAGPSMTPSSPEELTDSPGDDTQPNDYTPSNHTQPQLGRDQPLDGHHGVDKEAINGSKSEAVRARVEELEAERDAQGKTIAKLSRKLHKQRKIAATRQEILEPLVNENKRHSGLLDSVRESLNITNQQLSTIKNFHKDEVTRLKESINISPPTTNTMEGKLERSLVEEVKRPSSHAHSNEEKNVIDLDKLARSSVILDQSLLQVNWDPASGVDRRLEHEGVDGIKALWVTKRRAIEISDKQEKENQQWLLCQQSNHDQGRSPRSRLNSILDYDEDPEDDQPSKKRQRTACTPSHASLSSDFASSPPTYGGSGRLIELSRGAEVVSLQAESPIPITNDSRTEICVPSVDIMDRIVRVEGMLEKQKHEVQWLATEQIDRFERLTEELDESNRLNGDLSAEMSRTNKEQKDWEETVNARLDHQDSFIDATLKAQKHRIENLTSKFDNSLVSSSVRFEDLESKSNGQQELTVRQSTIIADMEHELRLHQDHIRFSKPRGGTLRNLRNS